MGKKGNWLSAVKKAFNPDVKFRSDKKITRSKSKWSGKQNSLNHDASPVEILFHAPTNSPPKENKCIETPFEEDLQLVDSHPQQELLYEDIPSLEELLYEDIPSAEGLLYEDIPSAEELKRIEAENERNKHAYSIALATVAAAEAAMAAAQVAAEVVRLTTVVRFFGKSREEEAALKIQTAYRKYLATRALRTLRGIVRLKCLMQGKYVNRQAKTTLRCMQTLVRVQSQIRARRVRMSEENQALERQLQEKREKEIESLKASVAVGNWNDSTQSKEQLEAKILKKQEAAMRREKALAYANSHQIGKNASKSTNPTLTEPSNPHWGWSWLERWMASRPWENRELSSDNASIKSAINRRRRSIGEVSKVNVSRGFNCDNNPSPNSPKPRCFPRKRSLSSPPSKSPSVASKSRRPSPKGSCNGNSDDNDDSISIISSKSELNSRRHSSTGSFERDNNSLSNSSPVIRGRMAMTKAIVTKPRLSNAPAISGSRRHLSYPSSTVGSRRHSTLAKMDCNSVKDISTY